MAKLPQGAVVEVLARVTVDIPEEIRFLSAEEVGVHKAGHRLLLARGICALAAP